MLVLGAALAAAVAPRGARADGDEGDRPPDPDVEVFVVRGVRPAELAADPSSFSSVIDLEAFEGENKSVVELLDQTVGVRDLDPRIERPPGRDYARRRAHQLGAIG
jgi:hypothetical protein